MLAASSGSNLVPFYVFCFLLPTMMYFLVGFFLRLKELFSSREPDIVYIDRPVYVEKPVKKEVVKYVYRDRPPVQQAIKKLATPKPVTKTPVSKPVKQEENPFIQDAVSALVNTGFKKMQAKKIVSDLCKVKRYTDLNQLILDAFSKV